MKNPDLLIVGGGASGLMAAGIAAEKGVKVVVLEKMDQVGRKLSITGKGRCNLTNNFGIQDFISKIEPDGRFLYSSMTNFSSNEVIELLTRIGIKVKLERGGRYFPENNSAPEVTKRLYNWCIKNNVRFINNFKVNRLLYKRGEVSGVQGIYQRKGIQEIESFMASRVILCTGGMSYPATGSDGDGHKILRQAGHSVSQCLPSLVPLEIDPQLTKDLATLELRNVRAELLDSGKVMQSEFGELTFIDTGISGPIILTLSRTIVGMLKSRSHVILRIDFKPGLSSEKLDKRLLRDLDERGREPINSILRGLMPKKLIPVCLRETKIAADLLGAEITAKQRRRLNRFMKEYQIRITGSRPFSEAIITKGGVSTGEFDQKTMESKKIKGLFVAGELFDLDGPTGGYNLQIAFTTAHAAANEVVKRIYP